jgi:hypothetical protein
MVHRQGLKNLALSNTGTNYGPRQGFRIMTADNLQKIRTDADLGNATYLYSILFGISRMG